MAHLAQTHEIHAISAFRERGDVSMDTGVTITRYRA